MSSSKKHSLIFLTLLIIYFQICTSTINQIESANVSWDNILRAQVPVVLKSYYKELARTTTSLWSEVSILNDDDSIAEKVAKNEVFENKIHPNLAQNLIIGDTCLEQVLRNDSLALYANIKALDLPMLEIDNFFLICLLDGQLESM